MLPKIDLPKSKVKLQSLGKEIEYRPFTNKEQKILLLAKQSDDISKITQAIGQIVENCTNGTCSLDNLAYFDLEYLFLKIRIASVSDHSEIKYSYKDKSGEKQSVVVNVDLNTVDLVQGENHSTKVMINDEYGIKFRYPTVSDLEKSTGDDFKLFNTCCESVFSANEVFSFSDYSEEEKEEFFDSLDASTMVKIKETFFDSMPQLKKEIVTQLKDYGEKKIVLSGLKDFF